MHPNTVVTKILELSREDPDYLNRLEAFRRPVTVMFTDIKGSTEYFERFGDIAGLAMVSECNELLRRVAESQGGRVIKTIGDSVMATFDSCDDSVRAAVQMQRQLQAANSIRETENKMLVRIGLHFGSGIVKSDDVFGDVVNVASRVESIAKPEQIVISDSLVREISPSQFHIAFLGHYRLKGKAEYRDLFEVLWNATGEVPVNKQSDSARHREAGPAVLQHLATDGHLVAEYPIPVRGITIGSAEGDVKLPNSSGVRPLHAKFSLEDGKVLVEDVGGKGDIFVRLAATHLLQQGDVIAMGRHLFKFISRPDLVAAVTTLGRSLENLTTLLNQDAAELLVIGPGRHGRYPLRQEVVTFGRTNGHYTFNDDTLMSRSHARIYHRGEDFYLEDLHTLNGTLVRVQRSTHVPLGTSVLIRRETFRVLRS